MRPLHDRILVRRVDADTRTAGGLYIPERSKEKPTQAIVVAVGPGRRDEHGRRVEPDVQVGDRVLFSKYSGVEVALDGADHIIMREEDLLAIVSSSELS